METKPLPQIFEYKQTINERTKLYLEGKHALLTSEMQKIDPSREETKWVWYPKEHIETWLEELNDLGGNGIRIYFGEKEVDAEDENDPHAKTVKAAGQLCLIIVPTKAGENANSNVNIIYEDLNDFPDREILYKAAKKGSNNPTKNFNFGSYGPPNTIVEGEDFPNDSVD